MVSTGDLPHCRRLLDRKDKINVIVVRVFGGKVTTLRPPSQVDDGMSGGVFGDIQPFSLLTIGNVFPRVSQLECYFVSWIVRK
jgi:hypothetical protein